MSDIEDYLLINNARLFYSIRGKGEPLVFVHGAFTDHRIWDYQRDAFASKYQVICFDQRGYGKSDLPLGPFSHMEDLKALMDALEMTKIKLVGSSLGGAVAIEFALQYPEVVSSLVLVGTGLKGYPYPPDYIANIMELSTIVQSQGIEAGINSIITERWWDYFFPSPNRPQARAKVTQLVKESISSFRWNPMWDAELKPSSYERVGEIQLPVLIISSSKDGQFVLEIGEYVHRKIKNSKLIMMENCGHLPYIEKPEEFNQIVLDFLQGAYEVRNQIFGSVRNSVYTSVLI